LPLLSVFLVNDFREGSSDSEDAELRSVACQSLWNQIKLETEVSLAPSTKAAFCISNNVASFLVSGDLLLHAYKGN